MRLRCDCAPQFDAAKLAAGARAAEARALKRTADAVLARAAALAPRRSGKLAASGRVEVGSGSASVRFTANYAAIQHERSDYRHPNGGQAGFLRAVAEDPATAKLLENSTAEELGAGL